MRINSILCRKSNLGWKARLRWKTKLRWKAKLPESTARETAHLIAMVLNMHLDPAASHTRRMVFRNAVLLNKTVVQNKGAIENNALMPTNPEHQGPEAEPAIQVVLHWRRFNQQRCHVEILSSHERSIQDPCSLAIANRLRQILN
jgi:hypothetical protein